MCTLTAIHRTVPGAPLVVAANRDEFFDRPATGPTLWEVRGERVLAPRDLRAGGTWLGIGGRGVFAALTNRPCAEQDASRRSRGLVVTDAMSARSAEEAAAMLSELPAAAYNPFNCFVADAERAFVAVYEDAPRLQELEPGAHVIANADPDSRDHPKVARVLARAEVIAKLPRDEVLDALTEICQEHQAGGRALDDTCVHLDAYGTRSSLLLMLGEAASESRLLYADGPPCTTSYLDFTSLLDELTRRASYVSEETSSRKTS